MKIFVARHGETICNRMHKVCGILEVDLSEEGKKQAEALAERLLKEKDRNKIEVILVSPLRRARETARPIEKALGIKAKVVEDLHEMNFGTFDGCDWYDPEFRKLKDEPFMRFPEGESVVDVARRVYNLIDRIRSEYNKNVLLVCHASMIRILDTYFHSKTLEEYKEFSPGNCSLQEYEVESFINN